MYIKPFISDIVRLGVNIEAVNQYRVFLRAKDDTFITVHIKDGWTFGVSIEYPSGDNLALSTTDHSEIILFIKKHLK